MDTVIDLSTLGQLDELLKVAADQGIDAALQAHGECINAREGEALRKLSQQELRSLNEINEKIRTAAGLSGPGGGLNWACGLLC